MTTRFIHFKNYNHIALTIATQESDAFPGHYYVGMALAHKNDNGNKAMGRHMSADFLKSAMDLEDKIDDSHRIIGSNGCYVVQGRDNIKLIMRYLRMIERCESQSRKNSLFHQAFFTLNALFSRKILFWDGQDIKKAEIQLDKFVKDMWVDKFGVLNIVRCKGQSVCIVEPPIDVTFEHITC